MRWLAATSFLVLNTGVAARAAVFAYTDEEGVIHLTNIPDDARYRPYPLDGKQNTFRWQDGVGRLRKVHQVDVTRFDALIVEAARYYSLPPALIKRAPVSPSSLQAS